MFAAIKAFLAKVASFLMDVVRNSLRLFKRDLKKKHRNMKNMSLATAGEVLLDEGKSFFVSAAKSLVGQALHKKSSKVGACLDACVLPYDECFDSESRSVSFLRLLSTASRQLSAYVFDRRRSTFPERVAFQFNIGHLYSLLA